MSKIIGIYPDAKIEEAETHNEKFRRVSNQFNLKTSLDLGVIASRLITDYDSIKTVLDFIKVAEPRSTFLIVTKNNNSDEILESIIEHQTKYEDIKGVEFRTIPWIPLGFAKDYDCPHGEDYKDIYVFFFTATEKMFDTLLNSLKEFEKANL